MNDFAIHSVRYTRLGKIEPKSKSVSTVPVSTKTRPALKRAVKGKALSRVMGKMIYRYSLKSAVRHGEGAESGPLSLYAHAFLAAPLGACHMARAGTDPHRRGIDVVGLPARLDRRKKPVSRIKCELYLGVPRHAAGFRIFSQGAYNEGRGNGAVSGRPWAPSVLRWGIAFSYP